MGLVNIASALTPNIRWRGHLLLQLEGVSAMQVFHALALPAGALLLLVSPYLLRRRRRAMQLGIVLLLAIGLLNLLKGLDFEESTVGWLLALALYLGRAQFNVVHAPVTLRSTAWRLPMIGAGAIALVSLGRLMPLAVHLVDAVTLLGVAYIVFRPLAAPRTWPSATVRRWAAQLVRQHGHDTLSFFKLRPDKHYFFNEDRTAFVGYRVEAGTLLLSGDPVGPAEALASLLIEVRRFAHARGLRLAALGSSRTLVELHRLLGLRSFYLGDEAIVDTTTFSLEGRPIRKVRQSVSRLRKAGYSAELCGVDGLDAQTRQQLSAVMEAGRIGRSERGFSMAMDGVRCPLQQDTLLVLARDAQGALRGVLHFVPCYGRKAMSLSIMRRDPSTPNGLMEFLVVAAIEGLRERGVKEVSLNFATVARWIREPANRLESVLGRVAGALDRHFQVESLYRFNLKFQPRWEPRYLVYEGRSGMLSAAAAAMWAEGQMPRPKLPHMKTRLRRRPLTTLNR